MQSCGIDANGDLNLILMVAGLICGIGALVLAAIQNRFRFVLGVGKLWMRRRDDCEWGGNRCELRNCRILSYSADLAVPKVNFT